MVWWILFIIVMVIILLFFWVWKPFDKKIGNSKEENPIPTTKITIKNGNCPDYEELYTIDFFHKKMCPFHTSLETKNNTLNKFSTL